MINEQKIPCPICQTKIPFDAQALIRGHKFSCPSCFAVIGIAKESVEQATTVFEEFKELSKSKFSSKNKKQRKGNKQNQITNSTL